MAVLNDNQVKEIRKLESLLKEVVSRCVDTWESGEGDISVEIRDDGGERKCKIKGGFTLRIR